MGMTERMINGHDVVFKACGVCGLWTWFEVVQGWPEVRCGICAQRGLQPGDVTLPPPAVQQAAVCAWDEEA